MAGRVPDQYPIGWNMRCTTTTVSTAITRILCPQGAVVARVMNVSGAGLRIYGTTPWTSSTALTVGAVAAGDTGASYISLAVQSATVDRTAAGAILEIPCARASQLVVVGTAGSQVSRISWLIGTTLA